MIKLLKISIATTLFFAIIMFANGILSIFCDFSIFGLDYKTKSQTIAAMGSFVGGTAGGLLAFSSVLTLILTFINQGRLSQKESIETRFFTLLSGLQSVQENMNYFGSEGAKAFTAMRKDLSSYIDCAVVIRSELKTINVEPIDLAFTSFYFGVSGEYSIDLLETRFGKHDVLIRYYASVTSIIKDKGYKVESKGLDGNQHRLGHYLRRMYQTIDYISSQRILNYHEMYSLAKILRSQLSTDEQVILLINSISNMGKPWREKRYGNLISYIEAFNVCKNIPLIEVLSVNSRSYYPYLDLEVSPLSPEMIKQKIKVINGNATNRIV